MNAGIKDAMVLFSNPPPIAGLSTTGGFELYVQDRTGGGVRSLAGATAQLTAAAAQRPELSGVRTTFDPNVPQYNLHLDRDAAKALGVPINSVFEAMQSTFAGLYPKASASAEMKLMSVKHFIDTNVLIYAFSNDDAKASVAEGVLAAGSIISVQVLNEFTNVCRRKLKLEWHATEERLAVVKALHAKCCR